MKKIISIILAILMILTSTVTAFADVSTVSETTSNVEEMKIADESVQPHTDGYYTYETSKRYIGEKMGASRNGVSTGPNPHPSSLSFSQSEALTLGCDLTFTNTLKGSFFNMGDISSLLGVTFHISQTYTRMGSLVVQVPVGVYVEIRYRPVYDVYEITQKEYYHLDGVKHLTGTRVSNANVFNRWHLYEV